MSHDSNIQWKTHAKRFLRGFPIETLELYFFIAMLFTLVVSSLSKPTGGK